MSSLPRYRLYGGVVMLGLLGLWVAWYTTLETVGVTAFVALGLTLVPDTFAVLRMVERFDYPTYRANTTGVERVSYPFAAGAVAAVAGGVVGYLVFLVLPVGHLLAVVAGVVATQVVAARAGNFAVFVLVLSRVPDADRERAA